MEPINDWEAGSEGFYFRAELCTEMRRRSLLPQPLQSLIEISEHWGEIRLLSSFCSLSLWTMALQKEKHLWMSTHSIREYSQRAPVSACSHRAPWVSAHRLQAFDTSHSHLTGWIPLVVIAFLNMQFHPWFWEQNPGFVQAGQAVYPWEKIPSPSLIILKDLWLSRSSLIFPIRVTAALVCV